MNKSKIKKEGKKVIKLESEALAKLSNSLNNKFVDAVELISNQNGKIIKSIDMYSFVRLNLLFCPIKGEKTTKNRKVSKIVLYLK